MGGQMMEGQTDEWNKNGWRENDIKTVKDTEQRKKTCACQSFIISKNTSYN